MCVQAVARKVAVIGLVVHLDGHAATREEQIADVEVTDKALGGIYVVAITKLTVYQQSVIKQSSAKQSLVFGVAPAIVARGNICAEVPVGKKVSVP